MDINQFIPKAKELVANEHPDVEPYDVQLVWYSKTLQNAKALLITLLPDAKYYEVTYNGAKDEIYFDTYEKVSNKKVEV